MRGSVHPWLRLLLLLASADAFRPLYRTNKVGACVRFSKIHALPLTQASSSSMCGTIRSETPSMIITEEEKAEIWADAQATVARVYGGVGKVVPTKTAPAPAEIAAEEGEATMWATPVVPAQILQDESSAIRAAARTAAWAARLTQTAQAQVAQEGSALQAAARHTAWAARTASQDGTYPPAPDPSSRTSRGIGSGFTEWRADLKATTDRATAWPWKQAAAGENKVAAGKAVDGVNEEETTEAKKLLQQVKAAGPAGIISYMLWELAFWGVSVPVCISAYWGVTGHLPDLSDPEDMQKLGAEAFAFVNVARFAVPLRIGLALGTTPWVQANIVDKFGLGRGKEQ